MVHWEITPPPKKCCVGLLETWYVLLETQQFVRNRFIWICIQTLHLQRIMTNTELNNRECGMGRSFLGLGTPLLEYRQEQWKDEGSGMCGVVLTVWPLLWMPHYLQGFPPIKCCGSNRSENHFVILASPCVKTHCRQFPALYNPIYFPFFKFLLALISGRVKTLYK